MTQEHFAVPYPSRGSVLGEPELRAIADVIDARSVLSSGAYRDIFEARFADLVGTPYALSVTSGTVALAIAVSLLDLTPGDEVIATPQTYKATIQTLVGLPIRVRFCDVDPATLNADPASIEALVTERTKAVIIVHYGGMPADMAAITRIAHRAGAVVVEDCAHALGSNYHGTAPGALGDIGCFSFHSSKNISTLGEGGMITLADPRWAERVDAIRSNEADAVYVDSRRPILERFDAAPWMLHPGRSFTHDCIEIRHPGTNATLAEPSAAVGTVQLGRLDALVARRREIAARLSEVAAGSPFVRLVPEPDGVVDAHHLYTCFLEPGAATSRDELVEGLARHGVETRLRYFPLHLLPEWRIRGHRPGECPVAERMWFEQQINLPCQPSLTDDEVDRLVDAFASVVGEAGRGRAALTGTHNSMDGGK